MSVLKSRRNESRAEFVNVAYAIFTETRQFLTKLSTRYSRLLSDQVIQLASEVLDEAEKANSIFPSDDVKKQLRETHLVEARASLMALDVHLAKCYEVMMLNPQGCFTTSTGKEVSAYDAKTKLNKMAENLGCLIDKENRLLTEVVKSDKKR